MYVCISGAWIEDWNKRRKEKEIEKEKEEEKLVAFSW